MVRGLAALLAATAYFLVVDALPAIEGDAGGYVGACAGALAVALAALAPLGGRDEPVGVAVLGAGAAFLAAVLVAQDVGAEANSVEALFASAAGLVFAWAFAVPAAVVALPLLVGGIDLAAVLAGSAQALQGSSVDILTFELPRWGGGTAARLGLLDATFLALFAAWSLRFELRPRLVIPLMVAALCGSAALGIALDRTIPALPLLAVAFLLPVSDRLRGLLARGDDR